MKSVRESIDQSSIPLPSVWHIYTLGILYMVRVACNKVAPCSWPLKRNRKGKEKHNITPPQRDIHADLTLLAQVVKPE